MLKIAHRGASGYAFENSQEAFEQALSLQTDLIEVDVQQSKDRQFLIFHDATLDRCTNGTGRLADYTLEELTSTYTLPNGEPIPTLTSFVAWAKKTQTKVLLELKNPNSAKQLVRELLEAKLPFEQFIIGSFFHEQLLNIKTEHPQICTCMMFECAPIDVEHFVQQAKVDYAALGFASTEKLLVERIQKTGVNVFVWTVNQAQDIRRAKAMDVDGIISNYVDRL